MTAFAMYRFAVNLGFAAGPATAGFLADRSFFLIFLGDAVSSVGYGLIALAFLPHGLRSSSSDERFGEVFRVAFRDRRFMLFLAATTLVTMVDFQTGSTFPLWVERWGHSSSTYGLLLSINGVLIIMFDLMITARTQRYPAQRVISLGYFLSGIGVAMIGLAHSVPALAATVCVWTLGEIIASSATGAYVTHIAPEQYRGRYNGLWVFAWSVGLIIGPSVGCNPRNGNAVMISASSTAPTVLPMKVARPPASAAPPKTAAVMLLSVNDVPICAFPIGERTMTNMAAIAAMTPDSTSARTRIALFGMPPRFAARSSNPTARRRSPDPEPCNHRSSRPAPMTITMNAMGTGPMLVRRSDTRSSLITP